MSSPRLPLSSRPAFLPDEISKREFATVFRGYDPAEVRTFLNQLSEQAAEMADRVAEIQRSLAETEERVKNPELDEEMVTKLLGEQTAQILRSAREAANETRAKAESEVSRQLRDAHEVTTKMREEAEAILAERTAEAERMAESVRSEAAEAADNMRSQAEDEAAGIRAEVAEETARLREETERDIAQMRESSQQEIAAEREDARMQARELVEQAREEAAALVQRTDEKQSELLEGLIRKRKIALAQVEELRAGRQRLLKAYKMVRGTLDEVTAELERVEDEARQAAELAGVRAAQTADLAQDELDTVIEMEQYNLDDDVPPAVIDLISEEARQADGAPSMSGGGFYDAEADETGGDFIVLEDHESDNGGEQAPQRVNTPVGAEGGTGHGGGGPVAMMSRQDVMVDDMAVLDEHDASTEEDENDDVGKIRSTSSSLIIGESFAAGAGGEVDENLRTRREAVVSKSRSQAVKRLKRALQDEQDTLVASLRTGNAHSVQALLGSPEDQASTYHRAVVKLFREVVRTGASSVEGSTGVEKGVVDHTGSTAARSMCDELVEDLRSQLSPVLEELLSADEMPDANTLQSLVAGPYRALKGDHLERLVDDRIGGAFDQGVSFGR